MPIVGSAKTIKADRVVADGPSTEAKEFVNDYVVVKAKDIDEIVKMAKANPVFEQVGSNIEVHEMLRGD